jgi:hypothetical protein
MRGESEFPSLRHRPYQVVLHESPSHAHRTTWLGHPCCIRGARSGQRIRITSRNSASEHSNTTGCDYGTAQLFHDQLRPRRYRAGDADRVCGADGTGVRFTFRVRATARPGRRRCRWGRWTGRVAGYGAGPTGMDRDYDATRVGIERKVRASAGGIGGRWARRARSAARSTSSALRATGRPREKVSVSSMPTRR